MNKLLADKSMCRIFQVADQAAACLKRLNFEHPIFDKCDTSSLEAVAQRIRANILPIDLPKDDGLNLRIARKHETPDALMRRCLNNVWRVCGHEYTLGSLDYNISPDPRENSQGSNFGEWTWQLNRHEEWAAVALLYHRTRDTRAVDALCSWIRNWIETCPAPTQEFDTGMTSWRTIEIGLRLGNRWPLVFTAIKDAKGLDDELLLAWLNTVAVQCDYVWPNRKTYNWLMMEMNGLLTAGVMFPFFTDAPKWEANALRIHIEEIDNQFLADGMQVELSASYHGVSFIQYLKAYRLLESAGKTIPPEFISGMRKMLHPWRAMVRPDGWIFNFQDSNSLHYPELLRGFPEEILISDDAFFTKGGPEPKHKNHLLPHAGQCVLRSGWTRNDTAVAIDVGPFGEAHQHEDKLSLQIWSRGQDILGEAGKVDYADSPQRRYSLGTLAHSTALVDGQDQNSRRLFQRGTRPLDMLADLSCDLKSATPWVQAAYEDGYGAAGDIAVIHERTVMLCSADLILVTDRFRADDSLPHTIEILFHLLRDGFEMCGDRCRSTGKGPHLEISATRNDGKALAVAGICGGTEPDLRGLGSKEVADFNGSNELVPRPCITITAELEDEVEIVTKISIGN